MAATQHNIQRIACGGKTANDDLIRQCLETGYFTADPVSGLVTSYRGHVYRHESGGGYVRIPITRNTRKFFIRAHRVIWIAVHGHIPEELTIDHINRIKNDNRIVNLRLATPYENSLNKPSHLGEKNPSAILCAEQVAEIRARWRAGGVMQYELAAEYGVKPTTISVAIGGVTWKHVEGIGDGNE